MTRPIAAVVSTVLVAFALAIGGVGADAAHSPSVTQAYRARATPSSGPHVSLAREVDRHQIRRRRTRRSHHFLFWHHGRNGIGQRGHGSGFSLGRWILLVVAILIGVPILIVLAIVWFLFRRRGARR